MNNAANNQVLPPFEELVELAQANPAAFSLLRQEICEEVILSASSKMQDRLWALQSHIDRVIDNCKSPELINARLMSELSSQVVNFQASLTGHKQQQAPVSAQIIPFPR